MTEVFIDTEFNGFGGALISMALVDSNGGEFYEALAVGPNVDPWVKDNVIPVLGKSPIAYNEFQEKLEQYLSTVGSFHLIADWPDDVRFFMEAVIVGPGLMMALPSFSASVARFLSSQDSKIPHNALEDARAIRDAYQQNERMRGVI